MSEKIYTILISGIACLLALVLTLCSVIVSHAEESDLDCKKVHEGKWSDINDVLWLDDGMPHADAQLTDTQLQTYPQSEAFTYRYSSPRYGHESIRVGWKNSSDQPLLVFLAPVTEEDAKLFGLSSSFVGSRYSVIISKDQFCFNYQVAHLKTVKDDNGVENTVNDASDVYMSGQSGASTKLIDGVRYYYVGTQNFFSNECDLFANSFSCFTSAQDAIDYLNDGDASKIAFGKGSSLSKEYDSGLLLNDFDVQFHDSNKFEECYLDVKYTIPDNLKGVSSFQIDMEEKFDWTGTISGSLNDVSDSHTGTNYIDVLNHADGFRIYLKDIKAIDNFVNKWDGAFDKLFKRFVIGNLNYVNFPFSSYVIGSVKLSNLNIKFHLVANKKYGHYVDYNLNLLSGVGVKNSYVPDSEGNYSSNNDSKVNGHYYTDVGSDAAGNTTYNYYYYYPDGGKKEVSSDDAANNTISNTVQEGAIRIDNSPTFNNNITVEGDAINNDVNNYVDGSTNSENNKNFIQKFLGFFELLENNSFLGVFAKVFGWLPPGISSVITTAIGISAGIGVFRFFRR